MLVVDKGRIEKIIDLAFADEPCDPIGSPLFNTIDEALLYGHIRLHANDLKIKHAAEAIALNEKILALMKKSLNY